MAGAGHEYPTFDVEWKKRDVLLFAASIGCTVDELHFLYELHPSFATFPTYPILLPFKRTSSEVIDFYAATAASSTPPQIPNLPKLDNRRMVDGQRRMTFHRPIPTTSADQTFRVRSKILGIYDKGKPGTVIETEQTLFDVAEPDKPYTTAVGSGFYVGQGGWGGPKGEKATDYKPPSDRKPDAVAEHQTTAETAHLYRLNGDYNPLHATPEPGKAMGFGGAIMHGLYNWNVGAHVLLKAFGGSKAEAMRSYEARFASPVKPGDKLVVEMWRMGKESVVDGFEEARFVVRVEGGKVCLSNGRAFIKIDQGNVKSKL